MTYFFIITKIPTRFQGQDTQTLGSLSMKGATYFLRKDHYDGQIWQQTIDLVLATKK